MYKVIQRRLHMELLQINLLLLMNLLGQELTQLIIGELCQIITQKRPRSRYYQSILHQERQQVIHTLKDQFLLKT